MLVGWRKVVITPHVADATFLQSLLKAVQGFVTARMHALSRGRSGDDVVFKRGRGGVCGCRPLVVGCLLSVSVPEACEDSSGEYANSGCKDVTKPTPNEPSE